MEADAKRIIGFNQKEQRLDPHGLSAGHGCHPCRVVIMQRQDKNGRIARYKGRVVERC